MTVPAAPAPPSREDPQLVLDAVAWCRAYSATIRWSSDRRGRLVVVEVLAPESTWNLLRGEGDTLAEAYAAVRGKYAAAGREQRRGVG